MNKKSISRLFDSKKINSGQYIIGGTFTDTSINGNLDTGLTANGTYDRETTTTSGTCDAQNTGYAGTPKGELDNAYPQR